LLLAHRGDGVGCVRRRELVVVPRPAPRVGKLIRPRARSPGPVAPARPRARLVAGPWPRAGRTVPGYERDRARVRAGHGNIGTEPAPVPATEETRLCRS